jgi:nitroreductase family protein
MIEYPEAYALHVASKLGSAEEVERYRGEGGTSENARLGIPDDVFTRRGSIRDFALEPISRDDLVAVLGGAMSAIPLDVPPSNEFRLSANAVAGLTPGAYRFSPPDRFALLRAGNFRRRAAYLLLEQAHGALAAATVFAMAHLDAVLERHGNRGYRAAQLEAGIRIGRVYLVAFARGLGATASTFYDDDVTAFLAPEEQLSPMLAAAVGRRRTRAQPAAPSCGLDTDRARTPRRRCVTNAAWS